MAVLVQRGTESITGTNTTATVTLPTPVAENQSAATVTVYGGSSRSARMHVTAKLQTVSNGNYTELLLTRGDGTTGFDVTVRWEVITHPNWSVQIVEDTIATSQTTKTFSFTSVGSDLSETFIIQGGQRTPLASLAEDRSFIRSRLTSTTAGELLRNTADATYTASAVIYVVTWSGVTVERGLKTHSGGGGNSQTQTITTIDQSNTYINYSYATAEGSASDRYMLSARFTANNTITFTRDDDGPDSTTDLLIAYEVISHADLTVQSDYSSQTATNATISHTLSPTVDTTLTAILGQPVQGNANGVNVLANNIRCGQFIASSSAASSVRNDTSDGFSANIFAVTFAQVASGTQALRRFILNIT